MKEPTPTAEETQLSPSGTQHKDICRSLSVYAKQDKILEERKADMQNVQDNKWRPGLRVFEFSDY